MTTPSEERPPAPEFVAYPRQEKVRKDPDPMPMDGGLALGRAVAAGYYFYRMIGRTGEQVVPLPFLAIEGALTLAILFACYAAGLGYRVGFGIFTLFAMFQIYGTYLWISAGPLGRNGWILEVANFHCLLFSFYAVARFVGWLKPVASRGDGLVP